MRDRFRVTRVARTWDRSTGKFHYDIRFRTRTEVTPRTVAVAEAFGLGTDDKEFTIYDNVELKIGPQDIVLITGESGSGKSVLLRALEKDIREDLGLGVANITDMAVDPNKPLIDTVGKTLEEGLALLSLVGLNDAFLFLRHYDQLSDGQKYRYRLAKLIESGKPFWTADEICATLDRDTAKIVAFNMQKLARRYGRAVLAATTHMDLLEDLHPSVHIHKGLGKEIQIHYYPNEPARECSLAREMQIVGGTKQDWKTLEPWHYRQSKIPPVLKIYTLRRGEETAGVIVYSYPGVLCFGRKKAFGRRIPMAELNRDFALISRVVLHPKYRSIGLGIKLVKETLPLVNKPFVETVAVMARYNPFFERAGLKKVAESRPQPALVEAVEKLRQLGFNPLSLASERSNLLRLQELGPEGTEKCKQVLLGISESGYYKRLKASHQAYVKRSEFTKFLEKASPEDLAKVLRRLAIIMQTKVYLFWSKEKGLA